MSSLQLSLGIERLAQDRFLQKSLDGKSLCLVANPASLNRDLVHSLDVLMKLFPGQVKSAMGPQHGMRGEKQYNMIESEDYHDPKHGIPVWSLYGEHRRPTDQMLSGIDVVLFDLQDLGCRIYTYLTTLFYVMEECGERGISVWVLDRPNPAGRKVEGTLLTKGHESFVGAGPLPMRHGMTLGEMAIFMREKWGVSVDLKVIPMEKYRPDLGPGFGWPVMDRPWINPSPNAATLNMARVYSGSVILEGTEFSEGRGTTRPLEGIWHPKLDADKALKDFYSWAPKSWYQSCLIRTCYQQPTFYKFKDELCYGIMIHTDFDRYRPEDFQPYRLIAGLLKAIRRTHFHLNLWRDFDYEYAFGRKAIDVITGDERFREWVEDLHAPIEESVLKFEEMCTQEEGVWRQVASQYLLYPGDLR